MIRKRTVRTTNPINCIGLRPHESMKKKATQYPGMRPAKESIRFPIELFRRLRKTEREVFEDSDGLKFMAVNMIEVFIPRP